MTKTLRVVQLRRKGWIPVATAESEKEPGKAYELKRNPATGQIGCACMAWAFGKGKDCKHIEALGGAATMPSKKPEPVKSVVRGETFNIVRAISFTDL